MAEKVVLNSRRAGFCCIMPRGTGLGEYTSILGRKCCDLIPSLVVWISASQGAHCRTYESSARACTELQQGAAHLSDVLFV